MTLRRRSAIPGRARFEDPAIRSRPTAAALQKALSGLGHVATAETNPRTGSVLVVFQPDYDLDTLQSEVEGTLEALERNPTGRSESPASPLARILQLSLPDRKEQTKAVLLTVGAHSLSMLQNLTLFSVLTVAGGDTRAILHRLGIHDPMAQLRALTIASLGLAGAQAVTHHHRGKVWQELARGTEHRLRTKLFSHLQQQDLVFFHDHGTGPLLSILTHEVESIGTLVEATDGMIQTALTVSVGGLALLRTSPAVALIIGGALPLVLLSTSVLGPRTKETFAQALAPVSDLSQALENILTGIVEIKSFCRENFEAHRVEGLSDAVAVTRRASAAASGLQSTVVGNTLQVSGSLGYWHLARMVVSNKVERAQFIRTAYWVPAIMRAFGDSAHVARSYYAASSNAGHLARVLDAEPCVRTGSQRLRGSKPRELLVEGISFGYDLSHDVLQNVSFGLPAGTSLGIVGPNGSGKSTLLWLLLRFHDPRTGRILLDGHDLRDLDITDLRSAISVVGQDVYLFDDTLGANVRYGRPDASDNDVQAALAEAGLAELSELLPDGLSTRLGERGRRLSGGQRQRVALARALLKDAPIIALDEATSHLDYEAEAAVKATLRTSLSGKSVILIAHRMSSIRDLDNIIVLDRGTIREQGTHDQLLERRGLYHRLWNLQRPE